MSHSSPQQLCTANPDIAGLGIRISVYIHAFLFSALRILGVLLPTRIRPPVYESSVLRLQIHILFIGCALFLAALIRATTVGLSVYHMLIVLNLGWINHFALQDVGFLDPTQKTNLSHFLSFIHSLILGIVGLWTWSTIRTFGAKSGCVAAAISTSLFGRTIQVTNSGFRTASIVFYSFVSVLAIFHLAFQITIALYRVITGRKPDDLRRPRLTRSISAVSYQVGYSAPVIVFIIDTELIVRRNRRLFDSEEFHWTLGQVLAMLLLIPLMNATLLFTESSKTPRPDPPIYDIPLRSHRPTDSDDNPISAEFSSTIPPS